jgi:hypothetical protein
VAIPQALTDAMNEIDTETNNLSRVVEDLRGRVKTDMSPQEVDGVTQALGVVANRLKGIAADPNNPIPNPSQAQQNNTGTQSNTGTGTQSNTGNSEQYWDSGSGQWSADSH